MLDHSDPIGNFEIIKEKQGELIQIREKRIVGTMIRARARWIEQSEKPSNYFCSLENRNFVSKRMLSLIKDNGAELNDFNSISKEVGEFYERLYSSREDDLINVDLEDILSEETPKLSDIQANLLEGPITTEEASVVIKI